MTRPGQSTRALRSSVGAIMVVVLAGGAFATAKALTRAQGGDSPAVAVSKIGPGYARMQPVNYGKPDIIPASVPHYGQTAAPAAHSQLPSKVHADPQIAAATVQKTKLPHWALLPEVAATLPQSNLVVALPYSPSDRHRIN